MEGVKKRLQRSTPPLLRPDKTIQTTTVKTPRGINVKLFKSQAKKIRGQGMSEYVIIVALIAVAAIAVTGLFGNTARSQIAGMAAELGGQDGASQVKNAEDYAKKADSTETTLKLGNYANQTTGIAK
jgi:hypothetical protein